MIKNLISDTRMSPRRFWTVLIVWALLTIGSCVMTYVFTVPLIIQE